jgi:hypothetical protein
MSETAPKIEPFERGGFRFVIDFDLELQIGDWMTVWIFDKHERTKPLLTRVFYFDRNINHLRAFIKKFLCDAHYRQACIEGRAPWVRLNRWYTVNELIYGIPAVVPPAGVPSFCTVRE